MKRVILLLILALFIIGMAAPSATFAGNSNKTVAFDRDAREMGQTRTSAAHDMKRTWGESLRNLFGRYFISKLPGTGIIVIDISWNDQDGPLNGPPPDPGQGSTELSDRRPIDEDPWEEAK